MAKKQKQPTNKQLQEEFDALLLQQLETREARKKAKKVKTKTASKKPARKPAKKITKPDSDLAALQAMTLNLFTAQEKKKKARKKHNMLWAGFEMDIDVLDAEDEY